MARAAALAQAAILDLCGDTAAGWLAGRVAVLWDRWAGQPQARRELLVRLDALDGLLAQPGADAGRTARWTALRTATLDALRRSPVGPVAGTLRTPSPAAPPNGWGPDANDPAYGGDPYARYPRWGRTVRP